MKTVESSAVFQPKQWPEKASREDNRKIENRTQPELVPNQASKSNIVRGALKAETIPGAVNVRPGETKVANEDGRRPHADKGTRVVVFGDSD